MIQHFLAWKALFDWRPSDGIKVYFFHLWPVEFNTCILTLLRKKTKFKSILPLSFFFIPPAAEATKQSVLSSFEATDNTRFPTPSTALLCILCKMAGCRGRRTGNGEHHRWTLECFFLMLAHFILRKLCCFYHVRYFLKQVFSYVRLVVVSVLVVLHGGQRSSEKVEEEHT